MAQRIDLWHGPALGLRDWVKIIRAIGSGSFKPMILNLLKIALSRILMKSIKSIVRPKSLHYSLIANRCLRPPYRLNVYFPPKFICWCPVPNMMVFTSGVFGRWLSLDEVVGVEPHDEIGALLGMKSSELPVSCEDTQKDSYPWTRNWALTRHQICGQFGLGIPSLQNFRI